MKSVLKKVWLGAPWVLLGVLTVGLLGGILQPLQTDLAHTIGVLTAKGGTAVHAAHFKDGTDAFGKFTLFLTASVVPPVAGDIKMEVVGPAPLNYQLSSRFPPEVPLTNRLQHPWYRLEGDTLKGVLPGDSLALIVQMDAPQVLGEYALLLKNAKTGQLYLKMPIEFAPRQMAGAVSAAPPASQSATPAASEDATPAAGGEECH